MKRLLLSLSALMLSIAVLWAHDVEVDGIYYNLYDKTAEVTYRGSFHDDYSNEYSGSVTIPETITINSEIYSVTSIGQHAFEDCSGLTSVTILNSVTSIGSSAFYGTGIYNNNSNWDNGVLYIDNCLIQANSSVVKGSYTIKEGTRVIGSSAFPDCSGLTSVTIPNSVTSIGFGAFFGCSGLTSITIPNSVTSIGSYAFDRCSGLTEVTIGNSVTSIGSSAFSGCSGLTKVNYLGTVDKWVEFDWNFPNSNPTYYAKDLYINNELLTDVKITTADSIKNYAFYNCQSIKSVEIGESVTSIGNAFYNCSGLTKVNYLGTVDKWVEIDFEDSDSNPTYYAKDLYLNNELLTDVKITTADSIKNYAFYYCKSIKSVEIGNNVTFIGEEAFYNTGIYNSESNRDNGVLYIDNCLIQANRSVVKGSYTIKEGTRVISGSAFYNCSNLSSITIPNSVTSIGSSAFSGCSGLTKVNYLGTVDKWVEIDFNDYYSNPTIYGKDLYINNELLTDVKITTADSIKDYAFYNCQSIKSAEIGNSVTSIGSSAFSGCSGLTSVTIVESVTSIGQYAFSGCSGLTSVVWNAKNCEEFSSWIYNPFFDICSNITSFTFGNEVEHIPAYLCYGMSKLVEITFPNSVTSIDSYTFDGCSGLTEILVSSNNDEFSSENGVLYNNDKTTLIIYPAGKKDTSFTIPNSVTSIGSYAFRGCSGLTSVTIPNSVTSIGSSAFSFCSGLTEVTIPNSVTSISGAAFYGTGIYNNNSNWDNGVLYIDNCLIKAKSDVVKGSYTIKEGTRVISGSAFYSCSNLSSITIPNSIIYIDYYAFEGCNNLKTVYNCSSLDIVKGSTSNGNVARYADEVIYACPVGDFIVNYEDEIIEYIGDTTVNKIEIPEFVTGIESEVFASCANIDTIVWNAINCADFTEKNAPFNAQAAQIKSVIFGNNVEYIPAYLCSDMTLLTEVSIPSKVNSIGENAFKGCSRLKFITSYPTLVPLAKENSFNSYSAYLYIPCDYYDYYYLDDVFGKFTEIKCISAEEVEGSDKVQIEVDSNNNATIIWPSTGNASSYELVISKNGEVFCTLLFNENGQLTSIDFGNRSASVGFQFTVTGLDAASKYSYSIVAKDEKGNELESYNGTFTTNGYSEVTAILETLADANITISDGFIACPDAEFTIYNTLGQDVTDLNGALTPGVYVVQVVDDFVKVMVK